MTVLRLRTKRNGTRKEREQNDLAEGSCSRTERNDLKKSQNMPSPNQRNTLKKTKNILIDATKKM